MNLGHHTRDLYTQQSIFSWILFVENKTKRTKRKIYKPVPPNVGPCRMLGAAHFFHSRLHPCQYLVFFIWRSGKNRENPNIRKKSKIRRTKTYPNSVWYRFMIWLWFALFNLAFNISRKIYISNSLQIFVRGIDPPTVLPIHKFR